MTNIIRYSLMLAITLCMAISVNAQKFGYTDSQVILMELPDTKRADAKMETLGKQLQARSEKMIASYQAKRADIEKRYQDGLLSQIQLEQEAAELSKEEQEIIKGQQDMEKQLMDKRLELIQPILDKVTKAIDDVAAEKGITYVLDKSSGIILYAKPSDDITEAVKAKLGM